MVGGNKGGGGMEKARKSNKRISEGGSKKSGNLVS